MPSSNKQIGVGGALLFLMSFAAAHAQGADPFLTVVFEPGFFVETDQSFPGIGARLGVFLPHGLGVGVGCSTFEVSPVLESYDQASNEYTGRSFLWAAIERPILRRLRGRLSVRGEYADLDRVGSETEVHHSGRMLASVMDAGLALRFGPVSLRGELGAGYRNQELKQRYRDQFGQDRVSSDDDAGVVGEATIGLGLAIDLR